MKTMATYSDYEQRELDIASGVEMDRMKMTRPIHQIAADIKAHWPKPYLGAVPYISAMQLLYNINEEYVYDSARSIVLYFLGNAKTWRGPDARRIKAELREMLK
jgi:hypothetical protein